MHKFLNDSQKSIVVNDIHKFLKIYIQYKTINIFHYIIFILQISIQDCSLTRPKYRSKRFNRVPRYPKTRHVTKTNRKRTLLGRMMGRMKLGVKQPGKFYRAKEQSVSLDKSRMKRGAPAHAVFPVGWSAERGAEGGERGEGRGESAERFVPSVNQ